MIYQFNIQIVPSSFSHYIRFTQDYMDYIYAQGRHYPLKLDREAIICHEVGHYKMNHNLYSGMISVPFLATLGVFYKYTYASMFAIAGLVFIMKKVRNHVELKADEYVAQTLGVDHVNAMEERHKGTLRDIQRTLREGTWSQKLRMRWHLVSQSIMHVSLEKRIYHLEFLKHKYASNK